MWRTRTIGSWKQRQIKFRVKEEIIMDDQIPHVVKKGNIEFFNILTRKDAEEWRERRYFKRKYPYHYKEILKRLPYRLITDETGKTTKLWSVTQFRNELIAMSRRK